MTQNTYAELCSFLRARFGFEATEAKFVDKEGSVRVLTAALLPRAVEHSMLSSGVLQLEVTPVFPNGLQVDMPELGRQQPAEEEDVCDADWVLVDGPTAGSSAEVSASTTATSTSDVIVPVESAQPKVKEEQHEVNARSDVAEEQQEVSREPEEQSSPVEEDQEAVDTASPSSSSSAGGSSPLGNGLSMKDKVNFILAAFDADEDGHLDFEESCELFHYTEGGALESEVYRSLCFDLSADPNVGLGVAELLEMYARHGTIDRDLEVSLKKLQQGSLCGLEHGLRFRHLMPLLALPLAARVPLLGVPAAALLARRQWCN